MQFSLFTPSHFQKFPSLLFHKHTHHLKLRQSITATITTTTTTMSAIIDTDDTIRQALLNPEPVGDIRRRDFLDQQMVTTNTRAIQAKGQGDTSVEALDRSVKEHVLFYYRGLSRRRQILGKPFIQWQAERLLCEEYGVVPFDSPKPSSYLAPADLAFTTMANEFRAANRRAAFETSSALAPIRGYFMPRGEAPEYAPLPLVPKPRPAPSASSAPSRRRRPRHRVHGRQMPGNRVPSQPATPAPAPAPTPALTPAHASLPLTASTPRETTRGRRNSV